MTLLSKGQTSTVRIAALDGLAGLVRSFGIGFEPLLQQQGIQAAMLLEPENRLPLAKFSSLLDAAVVATGDDCLGLHLGAMQSIHITGILGYAARACPDVRTQLNQVSRYFALHQDNTAFDLQLEGDSVTVMYSVYDEQIVSHRQDAEATLALAVNQCRINIGQSKWAPTSVHFEHPAPQPTSEQELRGFFGCPVYFSQPFNALRFPESVLNLPLCTADAGLHQILSRYADECLARHADSASFTGRARRLVAAGLSNGRASIEEVARRMAMTPRTLQRRLTQDGLQFSVLVDQTRRELATQYVRDERLTLTDAAFLIGYSDLTAFHRAFRRWFDQTPLEYRREHQAISSSGH